MMSELSPLIVIPASILMVASGLLVLAASIGIVRVRSFLQRTHFQAIIYSLSLWCLLLASLLLTFSLKDRTFLHEVLIGVFIFISSPISSVLLVRSYVLREERARPASDAQSTQNAAVAADSVEESEAIAASDVKDIEAELESPGDDPGEQTEDSATDRPAEEVSPEETAADEAERTDTSRKESSADKEANAQASGEENTGEKNAGDKNTGASKTPRR